MSEYTTREILEMIKKNSGPEGLDLSDKDLSGIDLSRQTVQTALEGTEEGTSGVAHPGWAEHHEGLNLSGTKLRRANMKGANLKGICLRDADLQDACLAQANLEGAFLRRTNLKNALLASVNAEGAYLWHTYLQGALMMFGSLREARTVEVNLAGTDLTGVNLSRVDLRDARSIEGVNLYRALFDHTQLTKTQLGQAIGEEIEQRWAEAKEAYLALKNNFEQIGRYDDASWAYRKERRMEKREAWRLAKDAFQEHDWGSVARKVWKAGWDLAIEYLCDYGESVGRVLSWMGFVILIAGPVIFSLPGLLHWPEANYDAFFGLPVPRRYAYAYVQQLLYVLDAFTTASFAELQPANAIARLLSALLALIGVFLTGLLGFVAGNRIRRS